MIKSTNELVHGGDSRRTDEASSEATGRGPRPQGLMDSDEVLQKPRFVNQGAGGRGKVRRSRGKLEMNRKQVKGWGGGLWPGWPLDVHGVASLWL